MLPLSKLTLILCSAALASLLLLGADRASSRAEDPPQVLAEKFLGDDSKWYDFKDIRMSDGRLSVLASSTPSVFSATKEPSKLWLFRLDQGGTVLERVEVKKPYLGDHLDAQARYSEIEVKGFFELSTGGKVVFADFIGGHPWIFGIDQKGKTLLSREIIDPDRSVWVTRVVKLGSGNYLLLGYENSDAVAIEVDGKGAVVGETRRDYGKTEIFVDAIEVQGGERILVCNSGSYDYSYNGPSDIVLVHLGSDGKITGEKRFAGRHGSLLDISNGSYVFLYDRSNRAGQDISLMFLDQKLSEMGTVDVFKLSSGFSPPRIAPAKGDGLLVLATDEGRLRVALLGKEGKQRWEYADRSANTTLKAGLVDNDKAVFLAGTTLTGAGKSISKKVRFISLRY